MITHFNSDGTVKQRWPEALTTETLGTVAHVHFSNSIQTVPLEAGEQVGKTFIDQEAEAEAKQLQSMGIDAVVEDGKVEVVVPHVEQPVAATPVAIAEPIAEPSQEPAVVPVTTEPIAQPAHGEPTTEAELLAEIAPLTIHELAEELGAIHAVAEHLREIEHVAEHAEPIAPTQAIAEAPAAAEPAAAPITTEPAAVAPVVADGV